jgi:hypothetical protein
MSPTTIPGNFVIQSPAANDPLLDLNTQPSLDLQFATSKTLDDRVSGQNLITFSRSTTGTYVDSNGVIQTAAIDAPRFDHDPTTNASLGLLVEESRTNLVTNSTNPTWAANSGGTGTTPIVTPVSNAAPDGSTNSAQRFQLDRGTGNTSSDYSYASITIFAASALYPMSVWLRSNDSNTYTLLFYDSSGAKGEEIVVTPSWKRYVLDASTSYKNSNPQSATSASLILSLRNDPSSVQYFTGNNNSQTADILAWGPQIEAGSFATSYIPTSGSTVTRAADVASITGSNFSRWYNQSEGSFYVQEDSINNSQDKYYIFVSDGANSDRLWLSKDSVNRHIFRVYDSANTLQVVSASPILPSSPGLVSSQFVGAYFSGDSNSALNGSIVGASTNNTFVRSGSNSAYLGSTASGSYLNGHIARLTYYPYRLSDATLQEITS